MKKILLAGIVILLVMFFVTCEEFFPEEKEVEYTDVEYSEDGTEIRLYLDGIGVPKTKAQRAMSLELAKMAYDYLEVIFYQPQVTTPTAIPLTISRAAWELGQPAGISGVYRTSTGVNYGTIYSTGTPYACIFVGKTDGKTLLGVGQLTNVDDSNPTSVLVKDSTRWVTFSVGAIRTGLAIEAETLTQADVPIDSFKFIDGGGSGTYADRVGHSSRSSLGGVKYPMYSLNTVIDTKQYATYDFDFVENSTVTKANILTAIKIAGTVNVQKRLPRYMEGGHYLAPKNHIDTKTLVYFRDTSANVPPTAIVYPTVGSSFTGNIPLLFITKGSGIFSFFIEIPVYMCRTSATAPAVSWDNDSTNNGPNPTKWYIRTGLDSELYSLDDGKASGGSVLMGVGVSSLDWLEIKWEWIP